MYSFCPLPGQSFQKCPLVAAIINYLIIISVIRFIAGSLSGCYIFFSPEKWGVTWNPGQKVKPWINKTSMMNGVRILIYFFFLLFNE